MTAISPQMERTLTRPWSTAVALAALFVALEGVMSGVRVLLLFWGEGASWSLRWEILRDEWSIYAAYLVIGLAAAYVLRLAARGDSTGGWPTVVLRAVLVYLPVSLVLSFVAFFIYAVSHDLPLRFLGIEVLS